VVEQINREPGSPASLPCAFIGAYRSAVSIPMSIVTGLFGYPQVSGASTSADLDDSSQYPLFARTLPSDTGNAIPIIIYMRNVLGIKHLAVIFQKDAYGNAYVEGLRLAAQEHATDMVIHQIPFSNGQGSIESAVANLKNTEFRFVFVIVFTVETHDALLMEAYNEGVAGTGKHNWLFGDSFLGVLEDRQFEEGSPLHKSYR
jgi:ABC-type branched-subunit amino acid transport system substrate-binding protein